MRNKRLGAIFMFAAIAIIGFFVHSAIDYHKVEEATEISVQGREARRDLSAFGAPVSRWYREWNHRTRIVKRALSWLGTPYRYGGETRLGVDCSGFVHAVIDSSYPGWLVVPRASADFASFGEKVESAPLPGDILLFGDRLLVSHVAISLGGTRFIHAESEVSKKVIVSDVKEAYWAERFLEARRFLLEGVSR
jgi:hypothetical protein